MFTSIALSVVFLVIGLAIDEYRHRRDGQRAEQSATEQKEDVRRLQWWVNCLTKNLAEAGITHPRFSLSTGEPLQFVGKSITATWNVEGPKIERS